MEDFMTEKEIFLTKAFWAQIKDTKDFFEEYAKLSGEDADALKKSKQSYITALKEALNLKE